MNTYVYLFSSMVVSITASYLKYNCSHMLNVSTFLDDTSSLHYKFDTYINFLENITTNKTTIYNNKTTIYTNKTTIYNNKTTIIFPTNLYNVSEETTKKIMNQIDNMILKNDTFYCYSNGGDISSMESPYTEPLQLSKPVETLIYVIVAILIFTFIVLPCLSLIFGCGFLICTN